MEIRSLGSTGLMVSSIGLGSGTFGREIDTDASCEIMDYALDHGINLIDTAESYADGGAEEVIGNWLESRGTRDRVVLTTKVSGCLTRDRVITSAEASLRRLKVDAVDLFQAHNWSEGVELEETLQAMHLLVEQGKARHIGCSNFDATQVETSIECADEMGFSPVEAIQPNYNLVTRDIERDLLPLCTARRIGVISYSPLGAGFLTGKYRKDSPIPAGTRFDVIHGHQDVYFSDENFRRVEALRSLAEDEDRSMIQLALAWVTARPDVTSVLIGARKTEHIDQALDAEEAGLSPELAAALDDL